MGLSAHSIVSLEDTKINVESCICLAYSECPGLLDTIFDGEVMRWPPDLFSCDYHNLKDWWDATAVALWCQGDPP